MSLARNASPVVFLAVLALFPCSTPAIPVTGWLMFLPQESIEELAARAERFESIAKWDDAKAAYQRILEMDPQSLAALNRLGVIAVRLGQFEEGIKYYKRALALYPSEFATNLNLGIAYIKKKDFASATPVLERAALAAPENFQAQELLAGSLIGQNDFARAIPPLEKASELNRNDVATLYLLNRSYLETKQFRKALPTFERLQALDPNSPWVRILRGQAEDGLGNYQRAIEEFEAARRQSPRDSIVRFSLGFMYWKVHRFTEAEPEIAQAAQLDPEFEEAKYYLADTYIMEEKPAMALPLLQALVHRNPRDARALADQGKALEKLNRDSEAARVYEACLRVAPERADTHYQLARIYKRQKRMDECTRELALAKKLQQTKLMRQETLLQASGERRNPLPRGQGNLLQPGSNEEHD